MLAPLFRIRGAAVRRVITEGETAAFVGVADRYWQCCGGTRSRSLKQVELRSFEVGDAFVGRDAGRVRRRFFRLELRFYVAILRGVALVRCDIVLLTSVALKWKLK